ncbi:zinc ribbon domain-containing protein [Clostridium sp.]|uniref:zinc ribbon domain-containing protein n=1 Tax=Clostridium sp. TaxID=1506 RepID=UPI002629C3FD|nr:zinc ribbon domain-containing protein [uncultured Clostridium sp.]
MTYCSKCGSKIEANDEFCQKCGVRVNSNPKKEKMENPISDRIKPLAKAIDLDEIINIFKNSSLNPVSGGQEFVAKAQKNHVVVIAIILTFIQGILGIWKVNQIVSCLSTVVTKCYQYISSLAGLSGQNLLSYSLNSSDLDSMNNTIDQFKYLNTIPYGKIFIENCGLYLVVLLVLFTCVYLGIKLILKAKWKPFIVFKAILISTLPFLICEIISIIFSYFSLYLGIIFVILGVFISIISLAIIVKESFSIKANMSVLIISISGVITLTVFFIAFYYHLEDVIKAIVYKYYILINH